MDAMLGLDAGASASASAAAASHLKSGTLVLARFGTSPNFYRATIVRLYNRGGKSLADVEWLRPQAGTPADKLHCCSKEANDETLHREGLEVANAIRPLNSSSGLPAGTGFVVQYSPTSGTSTRGVAPPSMDLLGGQAGLSDLLGDVPLSSSSAAPSTDLLGDAVGSRASSSPVDFFPGGNAPVQGAYASSPCGVASTASSFAAWPSSQGNAAGMLGAPAQRSNNPLWTHSAPSAFPAPPLAASPTGGTFSADFKLHGPIVNKNSRPTPCSVEARSKATAPGQFDFVSSIMSQASGTTSARGTP